MRAFLEEARQRLRLQAAGPTPRLLGPTRSCLALQASATIAMNDTTTITLPFPVSVYGTSYTSAVVESNGTLQFGRRHRLFQQRVQPSAQRQL